MKCPNCGSDMWDNTKDKRNPRSPDFKCKDKACGNAVWLTDKKGQTKSQFASGEPEYLKEQRVHEEETVRSIKEAVGISGYETLMIECLTAAERILSKTDLVTDPQALATTFFIQANKR